MKRPLRHSQRNNALRKLRFLSSHYLKLKSSAAADNNKLAHIADRIKSILQFLRIRASKKIIQQSMGAAFTFASLFLSTGLTAQNFSDAVPITQVSTEAILFPTLADIDDDGDLDVIGVTYSDANYELGAFMIENIGDNTNFELDSLDISNPAIVFPDTSSYYILSLDAADMDNDGDMDIVTLAAYYYDVSVLYYENNGDGTYSDGRIVADLDGPILYATDAKLVDIDDDGDVDILTSGGDILGYYTSGQFELAVALIENTGDADSLSFNSLTFPDNFPRVEFFESDCYLVSQVEVSDFDGDGDLDLLHLASQSEDDCLSPLYYENDNGNYVLRGELEQFNQPSTEVYLATSGDIDGDGDIDLLYEYYSFEELSDPYSTDFYFIENGLLSSVHDVTLDGKFTVLENPVVSELVVETEGVVSGQYNLSVYNSLGQVMLSQQENLVESNTTRINVSPLISGHYFLKMSTDEGIKTIPFVKQ